MQAWVGRETQNECPIAQMFDQYMQNEQNGSANLNLITSLKVGSAMKKLGLTRLKSLRKSMWELIRTASTELWVLDVIDEICNCDEVKAEEKIKLKYVGEESNDPRWVKKAKAKRLARKPSAQECETKESPKGGTGRKNGNGSQAGSSARPRNTRRAEMRAKSRRVPQPGDVHPSTKD